MRYPASEDELQRHLHDSGISRAGDKAKGADGRRPRIEKPVRIVELSVVEGVEEFSPVLERLGLREIEVLHERQAKVVDAGTVEEIPTGVANVSQRLGAEQRGIEVSLAVSRIGVVENLAGSALGLVDGVACSQQGAVVILGQAHRQARGEGGDA